MYDYKPLESSETIEISEVKYIPEPTIYFYTRKVEPCCFLLNSFIVEHNEEKHRIDIYLSKIFEKILHSLHDRIFPDEDFVSPNCISFTVSKNQYKTLIEMKEEIWFYIELSGIQVKDEKWIIELIDFKN